MPLYVLEKGRTSIRLMPGPCVEPKVSAFVRRALIEYVERFRALESTWLMRDGSTKDFAGCWMELTAEETESEPMVAMIFEDGERHIVPKSIFTGDTV